VRVSHRHEIARLMMSPGRPARDYERKGEMRAETDGAERTGTAKGVMGTRAPDVMGVALSQV